MQHPNNMAAARMLEPHCGCYNDSQLNGQTGCSDMKIQQSLQYTKLSQFKSGKEETGSSSSSSVHLSSHELFI